MDYNKDLWTLMEQDHNIKTLRENGASNQELKNPINDFAEKYIRNMLKNHDAVKSVIWTDKLCPEVDTDSKTDVVATLHNGKKLFIPVAKDSWSQTAQMDRMKMFMLKHEVFDLKVKYEGFEKPNYILVVYGNLNHALSDSFIKRPSVRKQGVQKKLKFLVEAGLLMDLNRLKNYLDELI